MNKKDQYSKDWLKIKKIMKEIQLMRYGGDNSSAYQIFLKRAYEDLKKASNDLKILIENK